MLRLRDFCLECEIRFSNNFVLVAQRLYFPNTTINICFLLAPIPELLQVYRFLEEIVNIIFAEEVPKINELELFSIEHVNLSINVSPFIWDTADKFNITNVLLSVLHELCIVNHVFNFIQTATAAVERECSPYFLPVTTVINSIAFLFEPIE